MSSPQASLTLLGCGPSTGVPLPACLCAVCLSENPKNKRMKASAWLQTSHGASVIIDTSTDFRHQVLRAKLLKLDAVLFTHHHADHILGLDDLRAFNFVQKKSIPCYLRQETLNELGKVFRYTVSPDPNHVGGKVASLDFHIFSDYDEIHVGEDIFHSFLLEHGNATVSGFRYGNVAYATDCHAIPERTRSQLYGVDTLVLGALRERPHPSHFSIESACALAKELRVRRCVLTHLSHEVEYEAVQAKLPSGVELAYDGMTIDIGKLDNA